MSGVEIRTGRGRFIWADKAALAAAVGILLILALIWVLALIAAGTAGAIHVLGGIGVWGVELDLLIAGSLWAFLRAIDFAIHGPTYRLFMERPPKQPASAEPALVSANQSMIVAMAPAESPDFMDPIVPLGGSA